MIEHEYRWPVRPQVLLALDLDVDAGHRQHGVAAPRADPFGGPALLARRRGVGDAAERRRCEREIGTGAARERPRAVTAFAKTQHLPAGTLRRRDQCGLRVDRSRMPDGLEEGDVLVAIRIAVALRKCDPVHRREIAHPRGLPRSPERRALDVAGEAAVAHHGARAQHMRDPQLLGDRHGLVASGRCRDRDRVPHSLMCLHEAPGLGEHPARDLLLEQPRPQRGELVLPVAGPRGDAPADDRGEFALVEVAAPGRPDDVRGLAATHLAAAEALDEVRGRRITVDQRAVEVEERADLRPLRTGFDGGDCFGE